MPSEPSRRSRDTMDASSAMDLSQTIVWRSGPQIAERHPRTLPELIARQVAQHGDHVVLVDGGRRCTWADLDSWSARLASRLAGRLAQGGHIAIMAHNGLPHLLAELAAWRLGALAVPIFTGYAPARLREMLTAVAPAVVLAEDAGLLGCAPADSLHLSPEALMELTREPTVLRDRDVDASTPCLIQFTSGSTGSPRGVVLSHGNLCSQQAAFATLWPEIGPGDRLASYLPWHHSFGALAERLWSLSRGACLTVVPGGGRNREQLITTITTVKPTVFMSVPKIHSLAMEGALFGQRGLRWAFTAGAPLEPTVYRWYEELGIAVHEGWGLTEASPSCTITRPGAARVPGVVGEPIPGVDVGVRASDGRIFVRGPNVMLGYFRQPSLCLSDGLLDSGDLGAWTEAGLRLNGRADHQLKLANGEKVSAAALEAALHAHAAIQHAVVAVEGALIAVIEAATGTTEDAVIAAVRQVNSDQAVPWARISEVFLLKEPMGIENAMLTASLKVSRGRVLAMLRSWRSHGGAQFEQRRMRP